MGFEVQVFKRAFPKGMLGVDGKTRFLKKYELHMNGKPFAAGMESIPETISEISGTFKYRHCESDEIVVSSPEPQDPNLAALTAYERMDFIRRATLLSFATGFLPN